MFSGDAVDDWLRRFAVLADFYNARSVSWFIEIHLELMLSDRDGDTGFTLMNCKFNGCRVNLSRLTQVGTYGLFWSRGECRWEWSFVEKQRRFYFVVIEHLFEQCSARQLSWSSDPSRANFFFLQVEFPCKKQSWQWKSHGELIEDDNIKQFPSLLQTVEKSIRTVYSLQ